MPLTLSNFDVISKVRKKMHNLAHEFTSQKVSHKDGIKIIQQSWQGAGMRKVLVSLVLAVPRSNRDNNPVDVIERFMVSVVLGASWIANSSFLRANEVIRGIICWKREMPSASTYCRVFQK